MVKAEFGLRGFEAILNRPATPLHSDQGLKAGSGRTPGREIGPFAVTDGASDQQATGPQTTAILIELARFEVGQFEIAQS